MSHGLANISHLSLCFRITLFCLLSYKIYDLIIAYVLPALYERFEQERRRITHLKEKEKILVGARNRLEDKLFNQAMLIERLKSNAAIWEANCAKTHTKIMDQQTINLHKLTQKRAIQQETLSRARNYKKSIIVALKQAHDEHKNPATNANGHHALNTIIATLTHNQ